MKPVRLAPNQPHHVYRGSEAIARFRGTSSTDDHASEDRVASTTTRGVATLAPCETLLVPFAAGAGGLTGTFDVICCLPPDPAGGAA